MPRLALLDLPFPGAGLLLRGRLTLGLGLLIPALVLLTAVILSGLMATSAWGSQLRTWLLIGYALLALVAIACHLWLARARVIDPDQVRLLYRQAASAFLVDRPAEALAAAERLAAHAGGEPGAWRLVALVADAAGEPARAARARRRLGRLLVDREGEP
jgi:hypothetical protein